MALGQVGARTEGDVYQGLFFWRQAADLLRPTSLVERVILEHDDANGVDDVAVFYRAPGVNAGGWQASADYFQLKYHVDNRDAYSADALIDPSFISAKVSLLHQYQRLGKSPGPFSCLKSPHYAGFSCHLCCGWPAAETAKIGHFLGQICLCAPLGLRVGADRTCVKSTTYAFLFTVNQGCQSGIGRR